MAIVLGSIAKNVIIAILLDIDIVAIVMGIPIGIEINTAVVDIAFGTENIAIDTNQYR